jgi:HlyD family secretion protein
MKFSKPGPRTLLVAGIVAVVLAWVLFQRMQGKPAESFAAQRGPLVQTVVVTGRVSSESRVTVGSVITARVKAVPLREGARVKAGDLLVQMEDIEQRAAVTQAEAALQSAWTRLDRISWRHRWPSNSSSRRAPMRKRRRVI